MIHDTVCPGSSDPFYTVSYYIKWATTSWTHSSTILYSSLLYKICHYFQDIQYILVVYSQIHQVDLTGVHLPNVMPLSLEFDCQQSAIQELMSEGQLIVQRGSSLLKSIFSCGFDRLVIRSSAIIMDCLYQEDDSVCGIIINLCAGHCKSFSLHVELRALNFY